MLNLPANINKPERVARGVIGGVLILGGLVGAGPIFMFIIGAVLIAEASLSYCGIVDGLSKMEKKKAAPAASSSSTTTSSTTTTNSSSTPSASSTSSVSSTPSASSSSSSKKDTTPPSDTSPKA